MTVKCGRGSLLRFASDGHQMSSNMGGSQHSAISFHREWVGSSLKRYRLLLLLFLLACYL